MTKKKHLIKYLFLKIQKLFRNEKLIGSNLENVEIIPQCLYRLTEEKVKNLPKEVW